MVRALLVICFFGTTAQVQPPKERFRTQRAGKQKKAAPPPRVQVQEAPPPMPLPAVEKTKTPAVLMSVDRDRFKETTTFTSKYIEDSKTISFAYRKADTGKGSGFFFQVESSVPHVLGWQFIKDREVIFMRAGTPTEPLTASYSPEMTASALRESISVPIDADLYAKLCWTLYLEVRVSDEEFALPADALSGVRLLRRIATDPKVAQKVSEIVAKHGPADVGRLVDVIASDERKAEKAEKK